MPGIEETEEFPNQYADQLSLFSDKNRFKINTPFRIQKKETTDILKALCEKY